MNQNQLAYLITLWWAFTLGLFVGWLVFGC